MRTEEETTPTPALELEHGVQAIARVLRVKPRRAYHLLEKGYVPGAFKMGAGWSLNLRVFRTATGEVADASEAS